MEMILKVKRCSQRAQQGTLWGALAHRAGRQAEAEAEAETIEEGRFQPSQKPSPLRAPTAERGKMAPGGAKRAPPRGRGAGGGARADRQGALQGRAARGLRRGWAGLRAERSGRKVTSEG